MRLDSSEMGRLVMADPIIKARHKEAMRMAKVKMSGKKSPYHGVVTGQGVRRAHARKLTPEEVKEKLAGQIFHDMLYLCEMFLTTVGDRKALKKLARLVREQYGLDNVS